MRRVALVLLALCWWAASHVVIFAAVHTRFDSSFDVPGYFAFGISALPLLYGAFTHERRGAAMRWLCVTWLSLQGLMMLFTWMRSFAAFPLIGAALMVWPDISHRFLSKIRPRKSFITLARIFTVVAAGVLLYWWHYNPLPSDENMIAHFKRQQTHIENLIKDYQDWNPRPGAAWERLPKTIETMRLAGVRSIQAQAIVWYPDPYSTESSQRFYDVLTKNKYLNDKHFNNIIVELVDSHQPDRQIASVITSTGWRTIRKRLLYVPVIPKVNNGKLWWPIGHSGRSVSSRIVSTLDEYPPDWQSDECVYRQIETQWFIYLCG